jgi:queuosine precursor transporter
MPRSNRFIILIALFITCLITANILIVKQFTIGSLLFPAGIIVFPITYILSDVFTEVYGYGQARRIIWLGFICNLVFVIAVWIGQILPPASVFDAQAAYERILGNTPRFLAASFVAYLAGEFANSFILSKMKLLTKGRWLWTRTIGSTIVGQGIDSSIVLTISFAGVLPWEALGIMIISHWLLKTAYEVVVTPVTYLVVIYLKKKENSDVYDYKTNFNPVRLD